MVISGHNTHKQFSHVRGFICEAHSSSLAVLPRPFYGTSAKSTQTRAGIIFATLQPWFCDIFWWNKFVKQTIIFQVDVPRALARGFNFFSSCSDFVSFVDPFALTAHVSNANVAHEWHGDRATWKEFHDSENVNALVGKSDNLLAHLAQGMKGVMKETPKVIIASTVIAGMSMEVASLATKVAHFLQHDMSTNRFQ